MTTRGSIAFGRRRHGRSSARQAAPPVGRRLGLDEILNRNPEDAVFRAFVELGARMSDPIEPRTLCACGYVFAIGEQPDVVVVDMRHTPIARPLCSDCADRACQDARRQARPQGRPGQAQTRMSNPQAER